MLVSILIPCYNASRWIKQAIESALAQSWSDKEVVVVDDGSTDDSLEIIRSFGQYIKFQTGPNRGGNHARNKLLELAQGEWVQYLDADDYLLPEKVKQQMLFLSSGNSDSVDIVISPVVWEYGSEQPPKRELRPIPEPHDFWSLLASWDLPQTGGPLWRKRAIEEVGRWNQHLPCCQEHELYLRLLMGGKRFGYCEGGQAIYRQWSSTTVCKRDVPEVHRQRLIIEERLEAHLRSIDGLTPARLDAINQARFQIARGAWQYDPSLAKRLMNQVKSVDRNFSPTGRAAPPAYKAVFQSMGFQVAERLAELVRR